jgi:hypothetical protein
MITHNGGATVTASGLCWSRTSNLPTIADDTTQGSTSIGIFTTTLTGLEHGTTYHVRAYAINKAGVGFGNTISFTTANAAPVARNIFFHGEPVMGEGLPCVTPISMKRMTPKAEPPLYHYQPGNRP